MKNKTKRILPIALIAIVLLSLLSVAEPVMALDECDLSIITRLSQSSYGIHDTIEYEVKLCNHERATVSYSMTIKLLDPDRDTIRK